MEDSQIIALFFERSEQAIVEISEKYGAAVRKTTANILQDRQDAEECVNDTWLGAWNAIPPQRPNPLAAFVCRIARNLALKKCHSNNAQKRNGCYYLVLDELAECIPSSVNVEDGFTAKEISAAISRFLDTLEYDDRFAFVRRYWFADSVSDIATMMDQKSHRVSVRLYRTRERLHRYLKKEGLLE